MKHKMKGMYFPVGYLVLSAKEKERICNGCGSLWGGILVPDTIWGLDISEACNVHDYMYNEGKSEIYKLHADNCFRMNMYALIEAGSQNRFTKWIRKSRADKYYWAVRKFGNDAYFKGKRGH